MSAIVYAIRRWLFRRRVSAQTLREVRILRGVLK